MGYTTGLLNKRITIVNRTSKATGRFGIDSDGAEWEDTCEVWAAVDFARGMRAMIAGAVDVYACGLVRMRWNDKVARRSRIRYEGVTYAILGETFHADRKANTIQFNIQEINPGNPHA